MFEFDPFCPVCRLRSPIHSPDCSLELRRRRRRIAWNYLIGALVVMAATMAIILSSIERG